MMPPDLSTWPAVLVEELTRPGRPGKGPWLFLGAPDTGKTTLIEALAVRLANDHTVAIVDADIGQSHIGPPTTVGWAKLTADRSDLSLLTAGPVSLAHPVGRLVALGDDHGRDLAIGIIKRYQPAEHLLAVRSPLPDTHAVQCITIGGLWMDTAP
jgi:hypothetical protein